MTTRSGVETRGEESAAGMRFSWAASGLQSTCKPRTSKVKCSPDSVHMSRRHNKGWFASQAKFSLRTPAPLPKMRPTGDRRKPKHSQAADTLCKRAQQCPSLEFAPPHQNRAHIPRGNQKAPDDAFGPDIISQMPEGAQAALANQHDCRRTLPGMKTIITFCCQCQGQGALPQRQIDLGCLAALVPGAL